MPRVGPATRTHAHHLNFLKANTHFMARTSQTARDSNEEPFRWLQREYLDHKGNKVILAKFVCWGRQFYQPEENEGYRL